MSQLTRVEELEAAELELAFLTDMARRCSKVSYKGKPYTLLGLRRMTGNYWIDLIDSENTLVYVAYTNFHLVQFEADT